MSDSEKRIFFSGQGRTKVCDKAYYKYAAAGNLGKTPPSAKKAIYGWTSNKKGA